MTAGATAPWIWEYSHLDGSDLVTVMAERVDLAELKKLIGKSFADYTWEEVERRGIFGTSVLVKRGGRWVDTGHWVYRKPAGPRRTSGDGTNDETKPGG